jgi:hypothetical protein
MILATAPPPRRDRRQSPRGKPVRRRSRVRSLTLGSRSRDPPRDPSPLRGLSGHCTSPRSHPSRTNLGPVAGARANTRPHGKLHDAGARTGRTRPLPRRPLPRRPLPRRPLPRQRDTCGHPTADSARLTRRRHCPRRGRESRRTTRSRPIIRRRCRDARHLAEGHRPSTGRTSPLPSNSRQFPSMPDRGRPLAPSRTWPGPAW